MWIGALHRRTELYCDLLTEMSCIFRQGVKIGEGIFVITRHRTHSTLPLTKSCTLVANLPTPQLTPVRRMAITAATKDIRNIGPMGVFLLVSL